MKIKILTVFTVIAGMLAFTGCKKGDTGPAGPPGNANVQAYTFNVYASDWTANNVNKEWYVDLTLPAGADVSGAVLVYLQYDSYSYWAALPHVDFGITFEYGFDPSTYVVEVQSQDAAYTSMIPNPGPVNFRVVTIPQAMSKSGSPVNWKNYAEVKKTFQLPD